MPFHEATAPPGVTDEIAEPGAKISRHFPKLLNDERTSVEVVAPTVNAEGALAGE